MNIIALDIGNTNINIGFFAKDAQQFIESISLSRADLIEKTIIDAWNSIEVSAMSKEKKRDGVIVASSVNPAATKTVEKICRDKLDENIYLIGKDVPLPIETAVDDSMKVGTDRLVAAAAAFSVVEDAVVVADFGTAVTIDLVDEQGVFQGGVIAPGFEIAAKALAENTAQLPKVNVTLPKNVYGINTEAAINAGIFYGAIGLLRMVTENYAHEIGKWPQTIVTGASAELIKQKCDFVDSWVSDLVVKGVVIAYKKYIFDRIDTESPVQKKDKQK